MLIIKKYKRKIIFLIFIIIIKCYIKLKYKKYQILNKIKKKQTPIISKKKKKMNKHK